MKRWLRRGLAGAAVLMVSPFVALVLIEVVGRATGVLQLPETALRYSPTKGYELDPANEGINSKGLRDHEYQLEAPDDTFRIVALGDSFTYGKGVTLDQTYVKQLEVMLNQQGYESGQRYQVLNAGIPGYNTSQEFIHLQEVGLQYNPDLILVGFTLSDAEIGLFGMKSAESGRWLIRLKEWMRQNVALYSFLRLRLKRLAYRADAAANGVIVGGSAILPLKQAAAGQSNPGWEQCREGLAGIAAIARARRIPVVLAIYPYLGSLEEAANPFEPLHRLVADTAAGYGIHVVELLPWFVGMDAPTLWISETDSHPNGLANAVAATGIYEWLLASGLLPSAATR